MTSLVCMGHDGLPHIFEYVVKRDSLSSEWRYRVTTDPAPQSGEFFELTLVDLEDGTSRVSWMGHHGAEEYRAKGIPEALLQIASTQLRKTIQSSQERGNTGDVRRSPEATKVWERLVARGLAAYDEKTDVYRIPLGSAK